MDRLLARLERTFLGRLTIERLTTFIVGATALVYVLALSRPALVAQLTLIPQLVPTEPWRLLTFLFVPQETSLLWLLVALYFTWIVGTNLENEWGAFKYNAYYFLGALGAIAVAWATGQPQGNYWLNISLFFAFATLFPAFQILLFFIIPVRVKWLGLLGAVYVGYQFIVAGLGAKAAIGVALANYLLFFSGHLVGLARGRRLAVRQAARRAEHQPVAPIPVSRSCAICGARQDDGADIRVCSCEKCGGKPRDLCLEHARSH